MKIAGINSFDNGLFKKSLFKRNEMNTCPGCRKAQPLRQLKADTFSTQSKN